MLPGSPDSSSTLAIGTCTFNTIVGTMSVLAHAGLPARPASTIAGRAANRSARRWSAVRSIPACRSPARSVRSSSSNPADQVRSCSAVSTAPANPIPPVPGR